MAISADKLSGSDIGRQVILRSGDVRGDVQGVILSVRHPKRPKDDERLAVRLELETLGGRARLEIPGTTMVLPAQDSS